jgi:preprotein translocase subunit SecF
MGNGHEVTALKVDFVGAKVGSDLRASALLSLLIMAALIFVYIFVRFDLVYAPGVVLALVHDVLITAGFFAMTGRDFDLTIVAALLTLAGYSINDTIVVYDRIREVAGSMRGKAFTEIINLSINQTLGRTIITGGSTFMATLALWYWGGPVIHGFATAILLGIIIGTYSSIFVAAPTILWSQKILGRAESKTTRAAA